MLQQIHMEIQVYDTYVKNSKGETMHFDVFLNKEGGTPEKAVEGAKKYLNSVGETSATITSKECSFCHVQNATAENIEAIEKDGYYIYKMSNSP